MHSQIEIKLTLCIELEGIKVKKVDISQIQGSEELEINKITKSIMETQEEVKKVTGETINNKKLDDAYYFGLNYSTL